MALLSASMAFLRQRLTRHSRERERESAQLKGRKSGRNGREIGRRVGQRHWFAKTDSLRCLRAIPLHIWHPASFGFLTLSTLKNYMKPNEFSNLGYFLSWAPSVWTSYMVAPPPLRGSSIYTLEANHAAPATPTTISAPTSIWTWRTDGFVGR